MTEFSELTKNFNKCRDYVRDFFVYGFKSRLDFTSDRKSARTYDNERRRITSWLSDYVAEDTATGRVKNISLQIDSNLLDTNPLFSVWKTKSFTDNDILLHFYILDILETYNAAYVSQDKTLQASDTLTHVYYSANELADILSEKYSFPADTQLVRRKCNEYVKEGLLEPKKEGKILLYGLGLTWNELTQVKNDFSTDNNEATYTSESQNQLADAISFFQLDSPFGYIGNTILEKLDIANNIFRVKHSFPTFTLEDEIAYRLLSAKNKHCYVKMDVMSNKTEPSPRPLYGVPLRIFVSTRTGRRYICIYHMMRNNPRTSGNTNHTPKFRFRCIRLDQIKAVTIISPENETTLNHNMIDETISAFDIQETALNNNLSYVWGVSFEGMKTKVKLTLKIDEQYEPFIINRLEREGKDGTISKIDENTFIYEKIVFDANEMFPWLRTFIGRIVDIHFMCVNHNGEESKENFSLRNRFLEDINATTQMYL